MAFSMKPWAEDRVVVLLDAMCWYRHMMNNESRMFVVDYGTRYGEIPITPLPEGHDLLHTIVHDQPRWSFVVKTPQNTTSQYAKALYQHRKMYQRLLQLYVDHSDMFTNQNTSP